MEQQAKDSIREGDGMIFFPSGRIAVTVCKTPDGCFHTFTADSDAFLVLGMLDPQGVGSINHAASGKPWLVLTREGWTRSDVSGTITQRGTWPRPADAPPVRLEVAPHLAFIFRDRQRLTARLSLAGLTREFECGQNRRRTEGPYLEKVTARAADGKLVLDLSHVRQRLRSVGSVYMAPGPHRATRSRGTLAGLAATSPLLAGTMADLDTTQARLRALVGPRAGSTAGGAGAASSPGAAPAVFADLGSPPQSEAQKRIARRLAAASPQAAQGYVVKRRSLRQLTLAGLEADVTGPGAPRGVVCVVCVLAAWNPVCERLERRELQRAAWQLSEEAAAGEAVGDAMHVRLFRYDASQGTSLQERFGFKLVPFILFFYEGALVAGSDAIRSAEALKAAALDALSAGRRGRVLPAGARVQQGRATEVLVGIHPHMSLLKAGGGGA